MLTMMSLFDAKHASLYLLMAWLRDGLVFWWFERILLILLLVLWWGWVGVGMIVGLVRVVRGKVVVRGLVCWQVWAFRGRWRQIIALGWWWRKIRALGRWCGKVVVLGWLRVSLWWWQIVVGWWQIRFSWRLNVLDLIFNGRLFWCVMMLLFLCWQVIGSWWQIVHSWFTTFNWLFAVRVNMGWSQVRWCFEWPFGLWELSVRRNFVALLSDVGLLGGSDRVWWDWWDCRVVTETFRADCVVWSLSGSWREWNSLWNINSWWGLAKTVRVIRVFWRTWWAWWSWSCKVGKMLGSWIGMSGETVSWSRRSEGVRRLVLSGAFVAWEWGRLRFISGKGDVSTVDLVQLLVVMHDRHMVEWLKSWVAEAIFVAESFQRLSTEKVLNSRWVTEGCWILLSRLMIMLLLWSRFMILLRRDFMILLMLLNMNRRLLFLLIELQRCNLLWRLMVLRNSSFWLRVNRHLERLNRRLIAVRSGSERCIAFLFHVFHFAYCFRLLGCCGSGNADDAKG